MKLELTRFSGWSAGVDQLLSAKALASYSMGDRWPRAEWRLGDFFLASYAPG